MRSRKKQEEQVQEEEEQSMEIEEEKINTSIEALTVNYIVILGMRDTST